MSDTFWNEEWKDLEISDLAPGEHYQISNYGRIKSFKTDPEEGTILKGSNIGGYKSVTLRNKMNKRVAKYIHRLVAQAFLEQPSPDYKYVIHLDFNKVNNHVSNLKWATKKEKEIHQNINPNFVRTKSQIKYSKLTEAKVRLLKRKINDPKRKTRLKMLARQFGISEMQLYRIKRGENWGHIRTSEAS